MKPTLEELKEQLNSLTEQIKKYESGDRFETGRWYKCPHDHFLVNCQNPNVPYNNGTFGYGFGALRGDWHDSLAKDSSLVPATPSEVEAALIAEAKKRGFKEGVWFNSIYSGSECYILNCKFEYKRDEPLLKNDALWIDGNTVYMAGQWATIIPQEEKIEIGNREVIIDKDNDLINVGCKTIYQIELQQISDLMRRCDFDTIQLDDHSPVSLKTINAILKKL